MAVPVSASVTIENFEILQPDKIVPGGAIELGYTNFDADGGDIFFWLSLDQRARVSSGDIALEDRLGGKEWDRDDDVIAELPELTVFVPDRTITADTYYVKVSDDDSVGSGAVVADGSIEVIEEDFPTITVDPTSETPGEDVEVSGEFDTDYEFADLFWDAYEDDAYVDWRGLMDSPVVEDGEFTDFEVQVTEAYMGVHKIIVRLYDPTADVDLGTFVDLEVTPSVELTKPDFGAGEFSIEALSESVETIEIVVWDLVIGGYGAHGFPDGEIDADSIVLRLKNIETGSKIEDYGTEHPDNEVIDDPPGTLDSDFLGADAIEVVYVEEGVIDLVFEVDSKEIVIEDALYSSTTDGKRVGEFKARMSATEGVNGDDVTFSAIGFHEDTIDVELWFDSREVASLPCDLNGAWELTWTIEDLAGGTYDVVLYDVENDAELDPPMEFTVLADITFFSVDLDEDVDSVVVEQFIWIEGTGFPKGPDTWFDTLEIGTGEVEIDVEVLEDGYFYCDEDADGAALQVPHTSGGGKEVTVAIKGEDRRGKSVTMETEITVDPIVEYEGDPTSLPLLDATGLEYLEPNGEWYNAYGATIFAGNPMRFKGWGFLADEAVTVELANRDEYTAEITDGGTADSDGDLELIFNVPVNKHTYMDEYWDVTVAGSTATNEYTLTDDAGDWQLHTSGPDRDFARLFFGLEPDGDVIDTVHVGDLIRVVGVGFPTKELTLEIEEEEVGTPTAKFGHFDTTITIPEMERGAYLLEETSEDPVVESEEWDIESHVTLTPSKAVSGAVITASGTGFLEDEETDIVWPGLPSLVTAEGDEDGSWEETFTVPDVEPGTYTLTFEAEELFEEDYPEVTFMVLGPLQIASLSMPTTVYNGSTIIISVNVQDYFGAGIPGVAVTGKITPPVGTAVTLSFPATDAAGTSAASWTVPVDAAEGTYKVDVTAEKVEAGGKATASGSFYVELKLPPTPPPPPVDLSKLEKSLSDLTGDVSGLASDLTSLAGDVSGLKSDIDALKRALEAIPIVPVEWIYITAIMAIIAAVAAIAAVVAVYRKIA